jgi:AraC family transcriptional regulator, positive regulator of tynA and feaB
MSLEASTSLVTTAGLPEQERFPFWRETACNLFGAETLPVSGRPFFAELATTRVKEVAFSHLRCREHKCRRTHLSVRQDRRDLLILGVLLRGNSRGMQDGREIELGPGDFSFTDTTRPYLATLDDDFEVLFLCVPREIWVRRVGPTEQITARAVSSNTYVGGLVFNFFRQLIPGIGTVEPATADRLAEVSLALLNTLAGIFSQDIYGSSGRIALLCRAKTLIEENLHDPSLNPEKIARALRISERYLRDLFHEQGTTVCKWMWDRRVENCGQRLSDPLLAGQSISEIASGCGFSNFAHFSVRFKAAFSISPSEFRREQLASKPSLFSSSQARFWQTRIRATAVIGKK